MTLLEALDAFILDQRLRGNTPKTISGYTGFIGRFLSWLAQNEIVTAADLTLQHVQQYQLFLDTKRAERSGGEKLTRRTIQTYMRHVKIFLAYCYEEGYTIAPIHLKMRLPKAEKPIIEILTDEEISDLLAVFGDDDLAKRNRAIIYLMLDCGLRASELLSVNAKNINFDAGYIKVTGKGRKQRIVPIGATTKKAITDYIAERTHDSEQLFLSVRGSPLTYSGIAQIVRRIKKQADISRLHAHLLRHTFATNFLIHGGDVYDLSRLLGHGEIKITENYLHLANHYKVLQNKNRPTYLDMRGKPE